MPSEQQVDPEEIGRRYLAKIVQLEIALPPPDPEDMRRVIRDYGPSLRHARPAPATEPRRRLRRPSAKRSELARVVQALRWWPLGVWFASGVAYGIVNPAWLDESENTTSAADWVWGLLFFVALALSLASRSLRGRARKQRDALREQIEELKVQGASPEQIKQDVAGQAASDRAATPSLISDLVSSSFLDSEEFREVETFISENPPTLPREAKRSFNHAQLLTEIARARHMFGGTPELTPAHLAKWLVLREQWPALGRSIVVDPERLAALEGSARDGDISPEAWELLSRGPRLSEVIVRLVYFQPAGNGRPPA